MPLKRSSAILLLAMLSACVTPETQRIVDTSCLSFGVISYAIPPRQADGTRDVPVDAGNRYDTVQTVADVAAHNAAWSALCTPG